MSLPAAVYVNELPSFTGPLFVSVLIVGATLFRVAVPFAQFHRL
ncbi:MAG: hypothetical protein Q8O99_05085 [bacterium]|nr:hypothetical protein [bacterium]